MDEIVKAAIAKWPNVPQVFGWLKLDARGQWRVKSVRASPDNPQFERIGNTAVVEFINRNYEADEQGRWFFQNGPQRVFVTLEIAPFVALFEGAGDALVSHTGVPLEVHEAFIDEHAVPLFVTQLGLASLDDRDLGRYLECLVDAHGRRLSEPSLEAFFDRDNQATLGFMPNHVPIHRTQRGQLAARFHYTADPRPKLGQPDCE
jgi:hypothetical protein